MNGPTGADAGSASAGPFLRTIRTAGGHRRFLTAAVRALLAARHPRRASRTHLADAAERAAGPEPDRHGQDGMGR